MVYTFQIVNFLVLFFFPVTFGLPMGTEIRLCVESTVPILMRFAAFERGSCNPLPTWKRSLM